MKYKDDQYNKIHKEILTVKTSISDVEFAFILADAQCAIKDAELEHYKKKVDALENAARAMRNANWDDLPNGDAVVGEHSWNLIQKRLNALERWK